MNYEVYGNYTLLEKLAMGGMAEVFLAKKSGVTGVEKFVAVKRILPQYSQQEEFIEMFKHEASIAINLSHSNIVSIFDFGLEKKQFYIVMDYVPGRNLRQILNHIRKNETPLNIEYAIFIIREIAAGLDYAHRAMDSKTGKPLNIIHRDISPQNVMISFEGEVRIVDFGIAKAESQTENTQAGTLKGKFGYMSPEQVEGLALDLRTDVFSLGILLWELLANDRLFLANNEQATIRKIKECKVPPLRSLNPSVPAELERIVNKALTRDRNMRYQAAAALQKDLTVFLNKYFPMFTTQDFAGFMKKQFNSEILDNRKKQINYSSVKHQPNAPSDFDEVTAVTNSKVTVTETATARSGATEIDEDSLSGVDTFAVNDNGEMKEVKSGKQENTSTFKTERRAHIPHPTLDKPTTVPKSAKKKENSFNTAVLEIDPGSFHRTRSNYTGSYNVDSSYRSRQIKKTHSSTYVMYGIVVICLLGFAYTFYTLFQNGTIAKYVPIASRCLSGAANCTKAEEGALVQSSVKVPEKVRIYVNSNPPNARIYVEGVAGQNGVKTTPDNIEVPFGRPVKVTIKMDGFNDWEKTISGENSETLTADLSKRRSAYLIANIQGVGDLYINHKKYDRCDLLHPCIVTPDVESLIEVYDPGTKAYDKMALTLSDGETKQVVLIPRIGKNNPAIR